MKAYKRYFLLVVTGAAIGIPAHAQTINAFAGNVSGGYAGDGGVAVNSKLNKPSSVAVDPAGNVYITDFYNNVVRKVSVSGSITTIAGNNSAGYSGDGGAATAAQLQGPWGVAVDRSGNVFVSDKENNAIRKITKEGIISTIAGNGKPGYLGDGKPATASVLDHPLGLAIDKAGNLYIADNSNTVVRKINTSGIISTFAGHRKAGYSGDGGPATAATFKNIRSLACADDGSLYISDTWNSVIRKVSPDGTVSTFAGNHTMNYNGDGGPATSASLYFPVGIAVAADGSVYFADNHNHVIRKVDNSGIITTVAGNGTRGFSGNGGPANAAQLTNPTSIAIDNTGKLFIAEFPNNAVRVVNLPMDIKSMGTAGTIDQVRVFPNPSVGAFTVELPDYKTTATITIVDVSGKVIETRTTERSGAQSVSFVLNNVARGSYIVNVAAGSNTATAKVVIE